MHDLVHRVTQKVRVPALHVHTSIMHNVPTWQMLEVGGSSTQGAVVELILADKETRGSKYYQVFCTVYFVCM